MFALVDCNCFYVSCQRAFAPHLNEKPVVVLSNNDGCCIARSNEAKALGIEMGAPYFKEKERIESNGVVVFSSNYELYADMSRRVMSVLAGFSGEIEIYSIDESFLKLTLPSTELLERGRLIQATVKQWTGIPVCVGMGPTKVLAKLANRYAKKTMAAGGVHLEAAPTKDFLERFDVGDVWGIGDRWTAKLKKQGVETVWDLHQANQHWVRAELGVVGHRLLLELRGTSCLALEDISAPKQGIMTSRSFGRRVRNLEEMGQAVTEYVSRAAEKLRAQGSVAGMMQVFIQTSPHGDRPKYFNQASGGLLEPTADTPVLIGHALGLLRKIFRPGFDYQKAGVFLSELSPAGSAQLSLLEPLHDSEKRRRLMAAVDGLNKGGARLFWGAPGRKDWQMKRGRMSDCFTTRWDEILRV